jgi:AraC-like DNA-binding protein
MTTAHPLHPMLPCVMNVGHFGSERDVPHHTHKGAEIVLVTQGSCRIQVDDVMLKGKTGTLFVLPARIPQVQRNDGFVRTTYIVFKDPTRFFDESARCPFILPGDPVVAWMEDLFSFVTYNPEPDSAMSGALLLAILVRLAHIKEHAQHRSSYHPGVLEALNFIERHHSTRVTATDIAAHTGLSVSHINALFRRDLGRSPLRYLTECRMKCAQTMLRTPYLHVAEVASSCGFDSTNYFIRVFRKQFGCSPGKWRRQRMSHSAC